MCYMTLLSTTADDDLTRYNNELVRFSAELPGIAEEKYLTLSHRWFIGSKSGCSCSFRHLDGNSVELGFGAPVDWFPEEISDLEATRQVIVAIRNLVVKGAPVEVVDVWAHSRDEDALPLHETSVNLAEVDDTSFRFFEGYKFIFTQKI